MVHSFPRSSVLILLPSRSYLPLPPPPSLPPIICQLPTHPLITLFLQSFYIDPYFPLGNYQSPCWIARLPIFFPINLIRPSFSPTCLSLRSVPLWSYVLIIFPPDLTLLRSTLTPFPALAQLWSSLLIFSALTLIRSENFLAWDWLSLVSSAWSARLLSLRSL